MREKGKMTDANALAVSTRREGKRRSRLLDPSTCSILAAIGMFGGLLSIAFGLFCAILDGIVANDTVFEQVSVALLMSGIPLMLIGSAFADAVKPRGETPIADTNRSRKTGTN